MKLTGRMDRHGSSRLTIIFMTIALILLVPSALSAVEAFKEGTEQKTLEPEKPTFFFSLGPVGMLNTDTLSAPSPIQFSLGGGANIPLNDWLFFSPSINAFTTYYLWRDDAAGGRAYPAEIENRTALAPSLLMDAPVVLYARTEKSTFSFGLGISLFARYAFLADSVPETKADDVKNINRFFYSGLRFIYPSVQLAYDFTMEDGMKAGVMLKTWLPIASLIENRGLDGGMASIGFRVSFVSDAKEEE